MSPLAIALACIGTLVLLNLAIAAFVRVWIRYRTVRASSVRASRQMREGVANFAVEAADELPKAVTGYERRLLRETILETAHELSGSASDRLATQFAERGYIAEAERALDSRLLLQRVRAAEVIGELGGPATCPPCAAGSATRAARPLRVRARAHRLSPGGHLEQIVAALADDGDDDAIFNQGALAEILLDSGPSAVEELRSCSPTRATRAAGG